MRTWLVAVIIFTAIVVSSCNRDNTSSPQGGGDVGVIWPIATGNAWTYNKTLTDTSGNIVDSSSVTMTVLRSDSNGTFVGHYIRDFIFWYVNPGSLLAANRTDGFYTATWFMVVPRPLPNIARALPYPTFPGDTLTYAGLLITTRNIASDISVPAGSFRCLVYDVTLNGNTVANIWASPNVGIVKTIYRVALPSYTYVLQSYVIN